MKKNLALAFLTLFLSHTATAQGIMTFDATAAKNSYQRVVQGAEQLGHEVQELQNQVTLIQNAVQNTLAPAAYVWDQSTNTIAQMQNLADQYKYYAKYGGVKAYADQFKDTGFYAGSPCYQASLNCDETTLWNQKQRISDVQTQANQKALIALQQQQENIKQQAATLERINATSHAVQGRLQSQETTNMYLSHIAAQQQQTSQALLANAVAEANERANRADIEARINASEKALLAHPDNSTIKDDGKNLITNGF